MKNTFLMLLCLAVAAMAKGQTPALSSNPNSAFVLMLDVDGFTDSSGAWSDNPALTVAASGFSTAQITELFTRISEDYRPFDINVTTNEAVFKAALSSHRQRVVFTPTDTFFNKNGTSAGGVSYVGIFGRSELPSWVFVNKLSYSPNYAADAGTHELGHSLTLQHHGLFDANCTLTNSYHRGQGSGQTSWGPLMGAPYGKTLTQWYYGATTSCTSVVDDLYNLTTRNGFGYRTDDVGNTPATAATLSFNGTNASATGIITTTADVDVYSFTAPTARSYTFNLQPNAYDANNFSGANLDTKLTVRDAGGNLVAELQPVSTLNTVATLYLNAGTYYLTVDGAGISAYTTVGDVGSEDYGSLGQYTLSVSLPACTAALTSTSGGSICGSGAVTLSAAGTGTISWYSTATGGTALVTGTTYTTPTLSTTTTYYAELINGSCTAPRVPVNATVSTSPTLPAITGSTNVKVGSAIGLSILASGGQWSSDNTSVATVSSSGVVTGVAVGTATITYTKQVGVCPPVSVSLTITVTTATSSGPQVLSTRGGSRCGPGTVVLSATASEGSTLQWFGAVQGGQTLAIGSTFTTPSIAVTTTYYVQAFSSQAASARTAVVARVDSIVTPGALASGNQTICYSGDPAAITFATSPRGGGSYTYQWYYKDSLANAPTGSSTTGWTTIASATQKSYDPPAGLTGNRTYAVLVTPAATGVGTAQPSPCGGVQWAAGARQVTVLPAFNPGTVTSGDQTFCKSGNPADITLSANPVGSGAYTWRWYYKESSAAACPAGNSITGWLTNNTSPSISGTTVAGAVIHFDPQQAGSLNKGRTFAVLITPIAKGSVPACGAPTWANSCRKTYVTSCTASNREGIEEEAVTNSISVYPNPAQEQFTISIEGLEADEAASVEIIDIQGKHVHSQKYPAGTTQFPIASSHFAKGVYQVIVTGKTAMWRARVSR